MCRWVMGSRYFEEIGDFFFRGLKAESSKIPLWKPKNSHTYTFLIIRSPIPPPLPLSFTFLQRQHTYTERHISYRSNTYPET
jgi:hypothetical protein